MSRPLSDSCVSEDNQEQHHLRSTGRARVRRTRTSSTPKHSSKQNKTDKKNATGTQPQYHIITIIPGTDCVLNEGPNIKHRTLSQAGKIKFGPPHHVSSEPKTERDNNESTPHVPGRRADRFRTELYNQTNKTTSISSARSTKYASGRQASEKL